MAAHLPTIGPRARHIRRAPTDTVRLPRAQAAPEYGVWTSNANLCTDNQPPYDPAMGTYQLRALLCRVAPAENPATDAVT